MAAGLTVPAKMCPDGLIASDRTIVPGGPLGGSQEFFENVIFVPLNKNIILQQTKRKSKFHALDKYLNKFLL